MHDVAWRGMWICVRSKDAQKQLARTSLNDHISFNLGRGKSRDNISRVHCQEKNIFCI